MSYLLMQVYLNERNMVKKNTKYRKKKLVNCNGEYLCLINYILRVLWGMNMVIHDFKK